ncbi:flippase [Candidatus Woesearchaeota archaeon]|nr:flippase [Candidatus Woesearchaeota archaeon]
MKENKSLELMANSAVIIAIGLIFSKFMNYIYRIVTARWLGPNEYGLLNLAFAFTGMIAIFTTLGFCSSIERYVGYYLGKNSDRHIKSVILTTLLILMPLSIFVALIIFIFSEQISLLIFKNNEFIPVLKIFAFTIPISIASMVFLTIIRAFKKMVYYVWIQNIIENISKVVITMAFLYLGYQVFGASIAYIIALSISALLSFVIIEFKIFSLFRNPVPSLSYRFMAKKMLRFSLPLFFSSMFLNLLVWTDSVMIGYYVPVRFVGIYNSAVPVASLILLFMMSFNLIFLPILSTLYGQGKIDEAKKVYLAVNKWVFTATLPILASFILFATPIIRIIFGEAYLEAATVLIILSIGYFIGSFVTPIYNLFNMVERTKINLSIGFIATVINISLNWLLIPRYGISGAAIATATSFLIWNLISVFYLYRVLEFQPYNIKYLKQVSAIIISVFTIWLLNHYLVSISNLILLMEVLLLFIIYLVLILFFKSLSEDDIGLIELFEKRIKSNRISTFLKRFV